MKRMTTDDVRNDASGGPTGIVVRRPAARSLMTAAPLAQRSVTAVMAGWRRMTNDQYREKGAAIRRGGLRRKL